MKREENGDKREWETEEGRRDGEEMKGREKQKTRQDVLMEGIACIASYLLMYSTPSASYLCHMAHTNLHIHAPNPHYSNTIQAGSMSTKIKLAKNS